MADQTLSFAAQAVLDAAFTLADNFDRDVTESEMIAAALRAAVDGCDPNWLATTAFHHLYAIADELEGVKYGTYRCALKALPKPQKPMTDFLAQGPSQPLSNCITFAAPATEEVMRIDKEGFHYRGQFIADAGEAHRLMLKFLKQNTQAALNQPEPQRPSLMDIIALADEVEEEGLGQVALVRRALVRWGYH